MGEKRSVSAAGFEPSTNGLKERTLILRSSQPVYCPFLASTTDACQTSTAVVLLSNCQQFDNFATNDILAISCENLPKLPKTWTLVTWTLEQAKLMSTNVFLKILFLERLHHDSITFAAR